MLSGVNLDSLTTERNIKALMEVNLIKLKRNGNLKVRICAKGELHFKFAPREKEKSPEIIMEILLDNMVIDAYEGIKVATSDVSEEYL